MKHRIVDKPAFEAVGWTFRTTTANGESMREVPKFWDRSLAEGKVRGLQPHAGEFGVLGLCAEFDDKMEGFTYMIGVEAAAGTKLPEGTQKVRVPAAQYAVFECVGAMPDGIQNGWKYAMGQWFPQSDWEQSQPANFERYPSFPAGDERGDPTNAKCYTEIWIPIRKKS
jgi:AraC family transcriptional regulator